MAMSTSPSPKPPFVVEVFAEHSYTREAEGINPALTRIVPLVAAGGSPAPAYLNAYLQRTPDLQAAHVYHTKPIWLDPRRERLVPVTITRATSQ